MFSSGPIRLWNRARNCHQQTIKAVYQSQLKLINRPIADARFLAVDLEMSGLSTAEDHILSIGWVPIEGREICLQRAHHHLLNCDREVGSSATIHGIRDQDLQCAENIQDVLSLFLQQAQGHFLIFHHAQLDLSFLNKLTVSLYRQSFKPAVIDTLHLRRKQLRQQDRIPRDGELRLGACRTHFGLPQYSGHNALTDALATAELFLAQTAANTNQPVRSVIY